jgi:hypothetical protein
MPNQHPANTQLSTEVQHYFKMMEIDFEQRSNHVIQLSLDHSRFVRICLLIWSAPLAVGAALLQFGGSINNLRLPFNSTEFLAITCFAASLINCIVLCAMVGNRNSSSLAGTAMNYMRSIYAARLVQEGLLTLEENAWKAIPLRNGREPRFKLSVSRSTDSLLVMTAGFDLTYSGLGAVILWNTQTVLCVLLSFITLVFHCFALAGMLSHIRGYKT